MCRPEGGPLQEKQVLPVGNEGAAEAGVCEGGGVHDESWRSGFRLHSVRSCMKSLLRGAEGNFRSFTAESLQNEHTFLLFMCTVSFGKGLMFYATQCLAFYLFY